MKYKRITILTLLLVLLLGFDALSQIVIVEDSSSERELRSFGIDPSNDAQVLNSLRSSNSVVRYYAITLCGKRKITGAIPIFKDLFIQYPVTPGEEIQGDRIEILYAVTEMEDTSFHNEFLIAIDSLKNREPDGHMIIIFADYLLKKHHDDCGFPAIYPYYADTSKIRKHAPAIIFLSSYFETQYRNQIVEILRLNAKINPSNEDRILCLSYLKELGYPQIESFLIEVSRTDTAFIVRDYARRILRLVNKDLYRNELLHAIQIETAPVPDRAINYTYLIMTREPWAYKFVYDVLHYNQDSINNWLIRIELNNTFLFWPDSGEATINLLDSLQTAVPQIALYNWLSDQSFVNELDSNLTAARGYIVAGDSNNCTRQIKLFQQKVDEAYKDSLNPNRHVTIEGWKFLYYNAQYILDRLPAPPPQYNLNINVIGNGTVTKLPELALYDSATTVQLTANPASGNHFVGWSGAASGTSNPISITMDTIKTVTATFVKGKRK